MEAAVNSVSINGVTYVREDAVPVKGVAGSRFVVVVDRGWIFAGDLEELVDDLGGGRVRLSRAVHVFSWSGCGFNGVLENPKASGVKLVPMKHDVEIQKASEIFRIPVSDGWGL